jgi:hypothetical protein
VNDEPVFERSIKLPFDYVFTARARPSTVRKTAVRLLPWALYLVVPGGGRTKAIALLLARRLSPLMKQNVKSPF